MNRYHLLLLLLSLPLQGFTQGAGSQTPAPLNPEVGNVKTINVRTIGFPPYGIKGKPKASGIYFDAANMLIEKAGYRANNHIAPYIRIINDLKSGQADLTIMFKYDDLEDHVIYIAPLPPLKTVVIGLRGTHFESIDALKGKTLAYLRGAKFNDAIDEDTEILKHETVDFLQGLKMLETGRVDAIIGPMDPILSAAKSISGGQDILGEALVLHENIPWVQISKKSRHKPSIERLQAAFQQLLDQGMLEQLRDKYL